MEEQNLRGEFLALQFNYESLEERYLLLVNNLKRLKIDIDKLEELYD